MPTVNEAISLIVGLGNPGSKYMNTRHNIGTFFLNRLCRNYKVNLHFKTTLYGTFGELLFEENSRCYVLLPSTFMNHSGQSVYAFIQYYKVHPSKMLIIHDELDLLPGIARFKKGGSSGGHNGLKDIIEKCKLQQFWRLRIGIGHPGHRSKVNNYVMRIPSQKDSAKITQAIEKTEGVLPFFLKGNTQYAMQLLHS